MTRLTAYLCAVPKVMWQETTEPTLKDLGKLSSEAIGCERRIKKGVNLENENVNYTLLCQQIEEKMAMTGRLKLFQDNREFEFLIDSGYLPYKEMPDNYTGLMSAALEEDITKRLTASFHPPETLHTFISLFKDWLERLSSTALSSAKSPIEFFELADQFQCGVVILQSEFQEVSFAHETGSELGWDKSVGIKDKEESISIPDMEITGQAVTFFKEPKKQQLAKLLRNQIVDAVTNKSFIAIGGQANNDVIAEVLHEFVFVPDEKIRPFDLRITYIDGSEAKPFPLFVLPTHSSSPEINAVPLNVALMSMRHLELDKKIDLCWFRNREVSKARTLAETDEFCYKNTIIQLRESLAQENQIKINLFHTGFEPAIIGFYRGLVRIFLEQQTRNTGKTIQIVPHYFRGEDSYELGSVWTL